MAAPCPHCRGDGMDPECDYLLPCPLCDGQGIDHIASDCDEED